jgi:hypothetical protein
VIVRVLGDGQYEVPDAVVDTLNTHDNAVTAALEAGDEAAFRTALQAMIATVHSVGAAVPADVLVPSDVVLPADDATLEEVREMLGDEGLVPG